MDKTLRSILWVLVALVLLSSFSAGWFFVAKEKHKKNLYLLFDTGLQPTQGQLISSNEKRFIIRASATGQNKIWIPVETTLIDRGFEEAWKAGAMAYLQEGVIRNGLEEGWVRIIDLNNK